MTVRTTRTAFREEVIVAFFVFPIIVIATQATNSTSWTKIFNVARFCSNSLVDLCLELLLIQFAKLIQRRIRRHGLCNTAQRNLWQRILAFENPQRKILSVAQNKPLVIPVALLLNLLQLTESFFNLHFVIFLL